jgi:glycosyltransferase involved in cell wall biosynthesis
VKKLKLLFDAKILAMFGRRISNGVPRVADELLRRFLARDDVDTHLLQSSTDKRLGDYLAHVGASHAKVIDLRQLARTEKTRTFKHRLVYGQLLKRIVAPRYRAVLRDYDAYFNPHYYPTPAIVRSSGVCTASLVHDVIPLLYPGLVAFRDVVDEFPHYVDSVAKSDVLFFVSEYTRGEFLRCRPGFPFAKTVIARPAVDARFCRTDPSEVRRKYGLPDRYIFSLSDENPRKNFQHALDAFAQYRQTTGDAAAVFAIGGTARGTLKLPPGAKQLGYVPDEDLPALCSGATAFLYPSLCEGFGIPPLEAMACGTPTVVGNSSAMPEVCGDAALYVSGFDLAETAAAIDKALNDQPLRQALVRKGLAQVGRYSWDDMANIIVDRLKAACESNTRP